MTEKTIEKLEEAFSWGCTDLQASLRADISVQTLYKYQSENPKFIERKEALKQSTTMLAKRNVHDEVDNGDVNTSRWHLEHKASHEYSKRSNEVSVEATLEKITPDEEQIMDDLLKRELD
jgi:hypothetical protein